MKREKSVPHPRRGHACLLKKKMWGKEVEEMEETLCLGSPAPTEQYQQHQFLCDCSKNVLTDWTSHCSAGIKRDITLSATKTYHTLFTAMSKGVILYSQLYWPFLLVMRYERISSRVVNNTCSGERGGIIFLLYLQNPSECDEVVISRGFCWWNDIDTNDLCHSKFQTSAAVYSVRVNGHDCSTHVTVRDDQERNSKSRNWEMKWNIT